MTQHQKELLLVVLIIGLLGLSWWYRARFQSAPPPAPPPAAEPGLKPNQDLGLKKRPSAKPTPPTAPQTSQQPTEIKEEAVPKDAPAFLVPKPDEPALPPPAELIHDLTISNCAIDKEKVTVAAASPVILRFTARDAAYEVTLPALDFSETIDEGATRVISFQASDEAAEYEIALTCGASGATVTGALLVIENQP